MKYKKKKQSTILEKFIKKTCGDFKPEMEVINIITKFIAEKMEVILKNYEKVKPCANPQFNVENSSSLIEGLKLVGDANITSHEEFRKRFATVYIFDKAAYNSNQKLKKFVNSHIQLRVVFKQGKEGGKYEREMYEKNLGVIKGDGDREVFKDAVSKELANHINSVVSVLKDELAHPYKVNPIFQEVRKECMLRDQLINEQDNKELPLDSKTEESNTVTVRRAMM